jgi:DNA-binding NtrC family response regulator/tetratricopeptide (TPR) repeat protein
MTDHMEEPPDKNSMPHKVAEKNIKNIDAKLKLVESLLEEGDFQKAFTEIRDLENQKVIDHLSVEEGELYYFDAVTMDKQGKPDEALYQAQKAYDILRDTGKNMRVAQVQHTMGIIYVHLGKLKEAEIQFTDAVSTYRRINDRKGIAKTYNELAQICFIRSKFDQAAEYIIDALDYCQNTIDQQIVARLHGNLGTIQMLKDQWGEAERNLSKSLQINETLQDDHNICKSLLSLGNISCLSRKFQMAEKYLQRAFQLISEKDYIRERAIYHEYQGSLKFALGNHPEAERNFREAIKIGEEIAPQGAIISQAYRLLAELQAEKGELSEAIQSCERSLQASKDIGEKLEEAAGYRILGKVYSLNDHPQRVKECFDTATQMLEEIKARFEMVKTYWEMGKCSRYNFWERTKFLGRAEDLASQLDSPYYLACVKVTLGELFWQNGEGEEALSYLQGARPHFEQLNEKAKLEVISDLEKKILTHKSAEASVVLNDTSTIKDSGTSDWCFTQFVTQDQVTLELLENVKQAKDHDIAILLEGETGTGKDLLAQIIHYTSNRKNNRFVVVSCSAIPEALLESELFGHKKGAFTGAVADKNGLIDEAARGTLYLDEIGEVPLPIQVKLLRAIEEKEFVRIGEVKPRKVDFRVIAATNKDLNEMIQVGKFRSDLFYRLSGIKIKLPSLRDKKEDIPILMERFLKRHSALGTNLASGTNNHQPLSLSDLDLRIVDLFVGYEWPGNARELENEVKRLIIAYTGEGDISFERISRYFEKLNYARTCPPTSFIKKIDQMEKEMIEKALAQCNGIKTRAARLLNLDEALLRYKIKRYNILPVDGRNNNLESSS